mgnify:CR=1 FL=1|tara:strand:+ start:1722 stop:2042 length:321 start_codon:yes stop_codon:yes gene_type:complete
MIDLNKLNRGELKEELFRLMDEVRLSLQKQDDVDDFLANTNLFDEWESILPDSEYPIFIISVLNNIRREIIIDSILDAVLFDGEQSIEKKDILKEPPKGSMEHPFC